jgi:hypothetical protein
MGQVPYQGFALAGKHSWSVIVSSVGVLATSVPRLKHGRHAMLGWVTLCCGVAMVAWALIWGLWRRSMLWFDDTGLYARLSGFPGARWVDIERVAFVRVNGRALLVVDRTDEARRHRPGGKWPRSLARLAKAKDLAVPLDNLAASPEKVVACVQLAHQQALDGAPS